MTHHTSEEPLITEFIEHTRKKDNVSLASLINVNRQMLNQIYNKAPKHKVFENNNDWMNYLLGIFLMAELSKQGKPDKDNSPRYYKTNAFINLAIRVDSYLKKNIQFLESSSEEEYKRNLNLCKDISIPCFNITSSFQSTETLIKNFFFCIFAAYQVIDSFEAKKIKEIKDDGISKVFLPMFEQKIHELPSTLKLFFDKKNSDDKNFFDEKITHDKKNLEFYVESIKKTKDKIIVMLRGFIRKCNNLFFTLMCRWFEAYLNSLLLIPSNKLLAKLTLFVNVEKTNEEKLDEIPHNLDEIIKKDSLFTILSDTSAASSYIFTSTDRCFKSYYQILDYLDEKTAQLIKNDIENLQNFGYDDTDNEIDYKFSDKITEIIFSDPAESKSKDEPKTDKQKVALLINKTIETFQYYCNEEEEGGEIENENNE